MGTYSIFFFLFPLLLSGEDDRTLRNGWEEIPAVWQEVYTADEASAESEFVNAINGRRVRFSGYFKQVQPHFAREVDYYLTPTVEVDCLPFLESDCCFCGADRSGYVRVLFNGSGRTDDDFDQLVRPERHKRTRKMGEMRSRTLDEGNYKVHAFTGQVTLSAKIKYADVDCPERNCDHAVLTVHLDDWSFE